MKRLLLALLLITPAYAGALVEQGSRVSAPIVTYQDRAGATHRSAELTGRVRLLHFWATWCGECRTELPQLDALQEEMRADGLDIAAIALDRIGFTAVDGLDAARAAAHLAIYSDVSHDSARALGIVGLPTTVILTADGREVARMIGAGAWDSADLRAKLKRWAADH